GRLDLASYEWQLQNYAYLRERQGEGPPVAACVLLFLNELHPTADDLKKWRSETEAGLTDVGMESDWRSPDEIPADVKFKRMIHVTAVTSHSRGVALEEFDRVVQKIELCRGREAAGFSLFQAWPGNAEDKATCDACDAKMFCPAALATSTR